MPDEFGVLYVAYGEKYRQEARSALMSLRCVCPGLPTAVITDREWTEEPRPDRFILRTAEAGFGCKPQVIPETPFDRTLYIDTDTIVVRDLRPLFGLLDRYDVGVTFAGAPLGEPGMELHPQCASGMVLFRNNERVQRMFDEWRRLYAEAVAQLARTAGDTRGVGDQRYLAIAIALTDVRCVHLPLYMDFWLHDYAVLETPPFVVHGHLPHMERVPQLLGIGTRWLETDYRSRVWLPNALGLLPRGIRRSDPLLALSLLLRRALNAWRLRRLASET